SARTAVEPDGVVAQPACRRAGGRGVGASWQAGPGARALDCPALAQRGHSTTQETSQARGGTASKEQGSPAMWTTSQARIGPPAAQASPQAPQGECEQTEAIRVAAGADQCREPRALRSTSRGAHALALANRAILEALQAGRQD